MGKIQKGTHIVQYPQDVSLCVGCGGCEAVCALIHEGMTGKDCSRIYVKKGTVNMIHTVYACQQCEDHPCYNACPRQEKAMCVDLETNIVYINEAECIGCKMCIKACPFVPKRIYFNKEKKKAIKCDLCRGREGGPACIADCQTMVIGLSTDPVPIPPPPPELPKL